MHRNALQVLVSAFFFGVGLSHSDGHSHSFSSGDVSYGDLYEVRDVVITDNDYATRTLTARRRLPMGRELTFTAVGSDTDYKVNLNLELVEIYGHGAKVYGALAGDLELYDRSYKGFGFMRKCTKAGACEDYGDIELL